MLAERTAMIVVAGIFCALKEGRHAIVGPIRRCRLLTPRLATIYLA
jgi:hypothetical protein